MKERCSQIIFQTNAPCQLVWDIMTNNQEYAWRSDVKHIELLNDTQFIEHGTTGSHILFTITKKDELNYYAFDMETKAWSGRWTGEFKEEDGTTTVILTEYMKLHNPFLHLLSYVLFSMKKQQRLYVHDLEEKIRSVTR